MSDHPWVTGVVASLAAVVGGCGITDQDPASDECANAPWHAGVLEGTPEYRNASLVVTTDTVYAQGAEQRAPDGPGKFGDEGAWVVSEWSSPTRRGRELYRGGQYAGDEAMVWMGDSLFLYKTAFREGVVLDLRTGDRRPVTPVDAPSPRGDVSMIWTGERVAVWGGHDETSPLADGALYDPIADVWEPIETADAPPALEGVELFSAGGRLVVWGRLPGGDLQLGGAYDAGSKMWTPISPPPGAGYWAYAVPTFGVPGLCVYDDRAAGTIGWCHALLTGAWTPGATTTLIAGKGVGEAITAGEHLVFLRRADGGELVAQVYDAGTDDWSVVTQPTSCEPPDLPESSALGRGDHRLALWEIAPKGMPRRRLDLVLP